MHACMYIYKYIYIYSKVSQKKHHVQYVVRFVAVYHNIYTLYTRKKTQKFVVKTTNRNTPIKTSQSNTKGKDEFVQYATKA